MAHFDKSPIMNKTGEDQSQSYTGERLILVKNEEWFEREVKMSKIV
jgi:hypothetical protein